MLARTPEPELMDEAAQAAAYAQADFSASHGAIVAALVARLGCPAGRVLDLGCGPADISVRLAQACPDCTIDGVDGAPAMLAEGQQRLVAEALESRIALYRVRLPDDPLPASGYDAIVSNSLLHHLHEPAILWTAIRQAAAPGASVFVADLARPASEAAVDDLVTSVAAAEPAVLQRDFRASLHAAFTPAEVEEQLARAGLALAVERLDDHHLLVHGRVADA